ncbi:hypothetical protein PPYR_03049 [Photinus pyralis]|uniref:Protein takeout n=1 Tax=Photinus pyralis TaxID=7054 RepID=A0A1Y1N3M8_PHOPY|nr:protein takeout-like [Photinus pyralis]XP_031330994.1 protein takeout-like [Photinus pyralis]KAB0791249.1 hypothetical protein PPYR_03049 [Photinus pyralis]
MEYYDICEYKAAQICCYNHTDYLAPMKTALLLFLVYSFGQSSKLPADYKRCDRNDPNFNGCLKDALEHAISRLANGDKSLGIPPLEPIHIPHAVLKEGTGAVHVVQKFTNLNIHKLTKSSITGFSSTLTKTQLSFTLNITAPEYVLEADYDFNGRLLVLPVVGVGKSKVNLYNVNTKLELGGEYVSRNGQQYFDVKSFDVKLAPGKVTYRFENLFNGNQELSNQIHTVLNENWREVFYDVKDGYEELIATVARAYANQLFSKIPVKNIFLK